MRGLFKKKLKFEEMTPLQRAAFYVWNSVSPDENNGGKDDCLMDLEHYDYNFVESFLALYVEENPENDEGLVDSAEQSLIAIRNRKSEKV